jgi:hypothetical protein
VSHKAGFWGRYALPKSRRQRRLRIPLLEDASWQEQFAMELLIDAIKALETAVERKRGRATVRAIRTECEKRGLSVFALQDALSLFKSELGNKKRGPKPAMRTKGKAGRPRKWAPPTYDALISLYELGAGLLRRRGKRITDLAALEEALRSPQWQPPLLERDIKEIAKSSAKRLPDARRALQK